MNGAYEFPGLVGGIAGTWLFLVGVLVATAAALRLVLVLRRPGAGRVARGMLAAGAIVAAAGIVVFWGAQASPWRAAFDRAAPFVGAGALLLAGVAGWAVARRRAPAAPERAA